MISVTKPVPDSLGSISRTAPAPAVTISRMTALTANNIVVVPIRSGVGFRLGANIGYLKFTPRATWNPF